MERKTNLLVCSNPKCRAYYEAARHHEGKAVKVGHGHYCSKQCAKDHSDAIKRGEREES